MAAIEANVTVGIITALPKEFAAAKAMLDRRQLATIPGQGGGRRYIVGEISTNDGGRRHVALAMLADMGNNNAAIRTTLLLEHFPTVAHVIMCGIAGGVPWSEHREHDVRLGDIVVSDRAGVVQYDLVKRSKNGRIDYRFPPRAPDIELLEADKLLQVGEIENERPWEQFFPRGRHLTHVVRPDDHLNADGSVIVLPTDSHRRVGLPRVFRGPIASANILLKDSKTRDRLRDKFKVKAIEMESSGIADANWISGRIGYFVVRGICDYCDDRKGDLWQGYAALAAACYVRALVAALPGAPQSGHIPPKQSSNLSPAGPQIIIKTDEWPGGIDLRRAQKNCELDILGDWYRDPWGWAELKHVVAKEPELIIKIMKREGIRGVMPMDMLKENFGIRPAIVFDPADRLVYQALVDYSSVELTSRLSRCVFGWRLPPDTPRHGRYVRNDYHWKAYNHQIKSLASKYKCALKTDITSFFATVSVERLCRTISDSVGAPTVVSRLLDMLRKWDAMRERPGIPQRSLASCVLANAYLMAIDDCLATYGRGSERFARWLDDIWLFADDPEILRKAQIELQRRLRELRLDMNLAKTDLFEGAKLRAEVAALERGAVDYGLKQIPPDTEPLDELIDTLLGSPERAKRVLVRFATTRMRRHKIFNRTREFVECANRMPHASDALARLFHDSGLWRELGAWFVSYAKNALGYADWSSAQLGTMFPTNGLQPTQVQEYFAETIVQGAPLPMLALAAQRLAAWSPQIARAAIRESMRNSHHPILRRVLAFAAVDAGEERATVRSFLREFEENQIALHVLEERNFKPFPVTVDFAGKV